MSTYEGVRHVLEQQGLVTNGKIKAFVGGAWRATKYDVVDPGIGRHLAQRVVVTPKSPAPTPTN